MPIARTLAGLASLLAAVSVGCGPAQDADHDIGPGGYHVDIVAPTPPDGYSARVAPAQGNPEACRTGCSLAKHDIPAFTRGDFEKALRAYAQEPAEASSSALDTLLFYGPDTRHFIDKHGTGALPAGHAAFLKRQLERDHAIVEIRMVEASGRVRIAYGPARVPLGQKEHLQPQGHDLQPLEINGTVMRTGLYHLWSRY